MRPNGQLVQELLARCSQPSHACMGVSPSDSSAISASLLVGVGIPGLPSQPQLNDAAGNKHVQARCLDVCRPCEQLGGVQ